MEAGAQSNELDVLVAAALVAATTATSGGRLADAMEAGTNAAVQVIR